MAGHWRVCACSWPCIKNCVRDVTQVGAATRHGSLKRTLFSTLSPYPPAGFETSAACWLPPHEFARTRQRSTKGHGTSWGIRMHVHQRNTRKRPSEIGAADAAVRLAQAALLSGTWMYGGTGAYHIRQVRRDGDNPDCLEEYGCGGSGPHSGW